MATSFTPKSGVNREEVFVKSFTFDAGAASNESFDMDLPMGVYLVGFAAYGSVSVSGLINLSAKTYADSSQSIVGSDLDVLINGSGLGAAAIPIAGVSSACGLFGVSTDGANKNFVADLFVGYGLQLNSDISGSTAGEATLIVWAQKVG